MDRLFAHRPKLTCRYIILGSFASLVSGVLTLRPVVIAVQNRGIREVLLETREGYWDSAFLFIWIMLMARIVHLVVSLFIRSHVLLQMLSIHQELSQSPSGEKDIHVLRRILTLVESRWWKFHLNIGITSIKWNFLSLCFFFPRRKMGFTHELAIEVARISIFSLTSSIFLLFSLFYFVFNDIFQEIDASIGSSEVDKISIERTIPSSIFESQEQIENSAVYGNTCLSCSICYDDFKVNDRFRKLKCHHRFHDACILPWLKVRNVCPMCNDTPIEPQRFVSPLKSRIIELEEELLSLGRADAS